MFVPLLVVAERVRVRTVMEANREMKSLPACANSADLLAPLEAPQPITSSAEQFLSKVGRGDRVKWTCFDNFEHLTHIV